MQGKAKPAAVARLENNVWISVLGSEAKQAKGITGSQGQIFVAAEVADRSIYPESNPPIWHFDGRDWGIINNSIHREPPCSMAPTPGGVLVDGLFWNGRRFLSTATPTNSGVPVLPHLMTEVGGAIWAQASYQGNMLLAYSNLVWRQASSSVSVVARGIAGYRGKIVIAGIDQSLDLGAVFTWDGSAWARLGSPFSASAPYAGRYGIACVAGFRDRLVVGGNFTVIGTNRIAYLAEWNGNSWQAVPGAPNGPLTNFFLAKDKLYMAGDFSRAGGQANKCDCDLGRDWVGSSWQRFDERRRRNCRGFGRWIGRGDWHILNRRRSKG